MFIQYKEIFPTNKRCSHLNLSQNKLQTKTIQEGQGRTLHTHQKIKLEDISVFCIYAPNIGTQRLVKEILLQFESQIDPQRWIVDDFNTLLLRINRSFRKIINREILKLIKFIIQMNINRYLLYISPKHKRIQFCLQEHIQKIISHSQVSFTKESGMSHYNTLINVVHY